MKLHLPKSLRNAVLACITAVAGISTTVGTAVFTGGVVSFTLAGEAMAADATSESGNQTLSHSGGNFTWNTTTGDFSNGDETVAFTQGDSVIFNGTSTIKFGEQLTAQCVTIAGGADVTISGEGAGSLALETAEVYGTLKLSKGGANGSFTGDVDVYGTLDFAAGDVTGWGNSQGIKSIDVFEGGRLHVSIAGDGNNQTGAGLAINLMGGSITGVSNANLDLGYGGSTYGYSSISARAAADATAENPTVSTVSGTNLTLRQNATTISVAENARLDISSGILVASGKALLNSEGSVPAGITAGLTKTGVGELRLSGNNTYTQATTVAEGTLTLTGGASLASSSITVNAGAVFCMDTAENTSFSYNNTVSGAGELRKIGAGSATLSYLYNNFTGTIALEEGSLRVGQSLTINSGRELSLGLYGAVLDSNLSLGAGKLSIDYSGGGAATSLNHSALTLLGGTQLQLSNLGSVDGRVFDLFTGIGSLQGSNGSTLVLDPTNNAVGNYFDISLLTDSSLWNNAILQMTSDGTLQIVRGNGEMKAPLTITSRQVVELSEYNLQCFESVAFENIDASASRGGAIDGVNIALTDNGNVSFTGNTASSSGSSVYGGAIDGNVTATGNGKVSFIGNVASGSTYCYGGAIHTYGDITLNNNGSVTFGENTVSGSYHVYGGAIYTTGDLSIRNNDSVEFYQNAEVVNGNTYRLRSIYAGDSGAEISLSAAEGKSITFRDSIYIRGGSTFKLNEAYEGKAQLGDIIFTGVTTETDLYTVKGNVAGTSAEILASRTSEINAATLLYGGRLRVEEGAIYQGKGITAVENSAATVRVKDASLLHAGFDLTFNAGTTLELVGNNSVSGNVQMLEGSSLLLNLQETFGVTDVDGNLDFSGNMTLALSSDESWTCENGVLMYVNGELSGWNAERLTVTGAGTYSTADIRWVDNMLVLNYNADTFNKYYNGSATYTTLQPSVLYHHYETIRFADIEGNPTGGAVYGTDGSSFSLSHNGSVEFIGNSANFSDTVYGGAIYAGEGISLHNNASVIFRENSASVIENNYGAAYGGAIFGYGDIALSYNGIVEFSGNAALAYSSYGGAIYGYGDISLSNNGSVSFSQNTAYESGGAIYGDYCDITLRNNTSVIFSRNTAAYLGGAIYGYDCNISLSDNGSVEFIRNTADAGGAIYGYDCNISLSNNTSVIFIGNSASGDGGAIDGYYCDITLCNNGSISFAGNTAATGGAICSDKDLSIRNNDSVAFYQNAEVNEGSYRLRSIYADGYGDVSLSAAAGKNITFGDSIYIGSGSSFRLNEDYTYQNEEGVSVTVKQEGDIIFTGADTEQHLNDLLEAAGAGRTATSEEILASRVTEVNAVTHLYGGRLRVEDGAVYQGQGITAYDGSAATVIVKNATLNHEGYNLNFEEGTTLSVLGGSFVSGNNVYMSSDAMLELAGDNTIVGDVRMWGSSTLLLNAQKQLGMTDVLGVLDLNDRVTVALSNDESWTCENGILMYVSGGAFGWDADALTVTGAGTYDASDLSWVGNLLILNYNAATFNSYFNGSAIYATRQSSPLYHHYESVEFNNITSSTNGAAISGRNVALVNNGRVSIKGNSTSSTSATACGGAIYASINIKLNNNESVTISGNTASYGGAIYGDSNSTITLSDNGSVEFSGNTASYGGAIYGYSYSTITLSDNGSVEFIGNTISGSDYARGGAIYGYSYSTITMSDNGSVKFSGNTVSSSYSYSYVYGGAIYAGGDLSIRNNEAVLFEKNAEITNGRYRLRSIYASGGSGNVVSLSASEGNNVEFRDSVYIGSGATANLNADYTDAAGVVHKQKGDIILTGKYAEQHLNELLDAAGAGRTATAAEILSSRTSEVNAMTNLYGGRLRVEDGAIYQGQGITVHEGSAATVRVKDASLSHFGYDLTFNAGTALELIGNNSVSGNVQMLEGSTLLLNLQEKFGVTAVDGYLDLSGNMTLALSCDESWTCENGVLLYVNGELSGWDADKLTVTGAGTYGGADISWVDNLLVLNYNAATFNKYFNGSVTYTTRQPSVLYHHYETIRFADIAGTSAGGAIYGTDGSSCTLSNNGSVVFEGNTTSSSGGAIYGGSDSTITLSDNDSVKFSGNTASSSSSSAYGGAIYGEYSSTITLSDNGSVEFSGNTASYGGAIYGHNIMLSKNGSVEFTGNTVSGLGGAIFGRIINLCGNESLLFQGNKSIDDYSSSWDGFGGAIADQSGVGSIILMGNKRIAFIENVATTAGGAIDASRYEYQSKQSWSNIEIEGNGRIEFTGNRVDGDSFEALGGAIATMHLSLCDNGDVTFSENTVSSDYYADGGAIYADGNLSIRNNDSVVFYQNAEVVNGAYRLRSIYAGGYGDAISLSAAAGKSITFRDSIYIGSGSSFKLNEVYEGTAQQGDIIFTGATTVDDLYTVKDNVAGTAEEIRLSRTTEVNTLTELYGGRLRVEEGAIYQGQGITAMEGSAATVLVMDATLSHSGYDLTFNAGTTLELEGSNVISGDVQMLEGSTLHLIGVAGTDGTRHTGSLSVNGAVVVDVCMGENTSVMGEQTITLFQKDDAASIWNPTSVTVNNSTVLSNGVVLVIGDAAWRDNIYGLNVYTTDEVRWNNAAGDSLWNRESANWVSNGHSFTDVQGVHVVLGADAQCGITLQGDIATRNLTVEKACSYELNFAAGSSLQVQENLILENNAALTIHGDVDATAVNSIGSLVVDGRLQVENALQGGSVQAGSLLADSLTAGSLALTDATAVSTVSRSVSLSGALAVAGRLEVSGSLSAGSLAGNGNTLSAASNVVIGSDIAGDENMLIAGAALTTGDIDGDSNELDAGMSITTGAIAGSSNVLSAGDSIDTGAVMGDANKLTARTILVNELAGTAQNIQSMGVGSAGDVVIDIESLTGTNATIEVLAGGKGSINIDSLAAKPDAGDRGTIISTLAGNVIIGSLNTTASTSIITASGYGIIVGSGSASNQVWTSGALSLMKDSVLTLTDSTVTISGNVSVSSALVILASTTTLTAGSISVMNGATIAGDVSATGAVTLVGGSINGNVSSAGHITLAGNSSISGELNMVGGSVEAIGSNVGSISGSARVVVLEGSVIGSIDMATAGNLVVTGTNIGAVNAAAGNTVANATLTNATIGSGLNVTNNMTTTGDVTVNGDVNVGNNMAVNGGTLSADNVTVYGAARLSNATIDGALAMKGADADVTATGGSIGSITGTATKVELNDLDSIGSIDMATTGDLVVTGTNTGEVNAAAGNTVANATLTNATIGSGLNVTNNMTTTGDVTVNGDVNVGNNMAVNGGTLSADNVTVAGTTTLNNGKVDVEGKFLSTEVMLNNISGEMEELQADAGLTLRGSNLDVTITGTGGTAVNVTEGMALSAGAELANAGGASIAGGLTVDEASFTNEKGLNLNVGGLTATNNATVTADGITNTGVVVVKGGSTVSAGSVAGATTVEVSNSGKLVGSVDATGLVKVESDGTIIGVVETDGGVTVNNGAISGKVTAGDTVTVGGAAGVIAGGVETTGSVTVNGGTIVNGAAVGGVVTMTGGMIAGTVTGATGAALINATIDRVLSMKGADADVTAIGGSIGSITGANDVTLKDNTDVGSITMSGTLVMNSSSIASVTGATIAELSNAIIDGVLSMKGADADVTAEGGSIGSITGANDVTLKDNANVGSITMSGTLEMNSSSIASVTGATSAMLSNATISSGLSVSNNLVAAGLVTSQGGVSVGGMLSGTGVFDLAGALSVRELKATSLVSSGAVELTGTNVSHAVTGDMEVDSVSLAAGSSLAVGGVLTTDEVQMSGTALTLTAGSFGASSMNFELDRAALESLGLGYKQTGTIAQVRSALASGFVATLNGGADEVQAGAYKYTLSTSGSSVQLTADYAHDGMQVWYRGAWVGKSTWTDFYIGGYDAVNGVEELNLNGATVQGANLYIAYEEGVTSAVVTNGSLEFDYVDLGGGQFEIGTGASVMTDELYGKGETLVLHDGAELKATELTLGTLVLNDSDVTVKKATINAITGTEGTLAIEAGGSVTVKSDVTLTGLTNEGSLNLGKKNLTVNALVDVGGNVTAGEVSVQSRGSRMAEFDKLVADKVTVVNSLTAGRYTDDLSVGDGSAIGELVAETLAVREGTVTLGRTSGSSEMCLLNLDLQEDATLVLNQQTMLEVTDTLTATENATVQLKKDAAVSYDGVNIANRKESGTLSVNAYALSGEAELELNGAHVAVTGSEDKVIDYKLVNSSVENAGTGTLQVTHAENSLSGVVASSGNVEVYNVTGSMSLEELRIATGLSVSIMVGDEGTSMTPENEADITVVGMAVFEQGATLNANLTLASGSTLVMDGPLHMGSTLELVSGDGSITLSGTMYEALASLEMGESLTLFTGVDSLTLTNDGISVTYHPDELHGVLASDYFGNLPVPGEESYYYITYTSTAVGGGELAIMLNIPEPATATLSLLALASLAARRRRMG